MAISCATQATCKPIDLPQSQSHEEYWDTMASLSTCRSATGSVVRSWSLSPVCRTGSEPCRSRVVDACRSTLARADVHTCSSQRRRHGRESAHSWALATERRRSRRHWEEGWNVARLRFVVVVPDRGRDICATHRTLSTITAKPVGESGKGDEDESEYRDNKGNAGDDEDDGEEEPSDSIYKILTGRPQADPAEHAEKERKYVFPDTMEGWKTLFRDVWTTYYSTFEGWETKEERTERERKERRERGLPVDDDDEEEEDDTETVYEIEYDEDALRRKKKEITDNFGRNLNIAHTTGQDLLEQAKEKTGIRTKEDLKIWAGEQMKLATLCLSEFMGGYREGRDEEVDRMLNEYFKDLDEPNDDGTNGVGSGEVDAPKGLGDTSTRGTDKTSQDDEIVAASPPKMKSGRRRRKRRS